MHRAPVVWANIRLKSQELEPKVCHNFRNKIRVRPQQLPAQAFMVLFLAIWGTPFISAWAVQSRPGPMPRAIPSRALPATCLTPLPFPDPSQPATKPTESQKALGNKSLLAQGAITLIAHDQAKNATGNRNIICPRKIQ